MSNRENKRLSVFTGDDSLKSLKRPTIMLYPFEGNPELDVNDPDFGRFDDYVNTGKNFLEVTEDPGKADLFVLPFEFSFEEPFFARAKDFAAKANKFGKKVLIFFNSDEDTEIAISNAIILRTTLYSGQLKSNEFALPGWSVDFLQVYSRGELKVHEKNRMPSVSYCGYVGEKIGLVQKFKRALKDLPLEKGPELRRIAVNKLQSSPEVKTHFIIRDGFWAQGLNDKKAARKEYALNMLSAPYALVVRGAGNFSYRLYEALSAGKIPVFINTECVLPYDKFISWKDHMVWIEQSEVNRISDKLIDFHKSISDAEFVNLQRSNRKLYEDWIAPAAFFQKLYLLIK